ncbi:patatin-like phospholipase family protein [Membranicola marinus]|uniref:Patatin-like phospholipase family protein n=1 Tax=Membranihabitans marinus TaxID=1227546 RepID=A0A953HNK1_9BACT|nr:patatin-like phospholipase family protein [Membranihabitans marinus]MBY5957848.1 patatin-like phospholipase family protein [Membranihabitans marinus]
MKKKKKKLALVLSGGGFKGAFQIGALEYLLYNPVMIENEVLDINHFDIISGVSVGSLNGAFVATRQLETLKEIWFDKIIHEGPDIVYTSKYLEHGKPDIKKILTELVPDLSIWQRLLLIFSRSRQEKFARQVLKNFLDLEGLADNTPLLELLKKHVHLDKFKDVDYKMGFVSLRDGRYKSVSHHQLPNNKELQKAIMASSTMPVIWPPIPYIHTIAGEKFFDNVDGGIRNVTPLKDVIDEINSRAKDDEEYYIIVINCSTSSLPPIDPDPSIVDIAVRSMLDITMAEIFKNDLEQFIWINDMLRAQNLDKLKIDSKIYRRYKIKIIQPPRSLGGTLDARPEIIKAWRQLGYDTAKKETSTLDWNA